MQMSSNTYKQDDSSDDIHAEDVRPHAHAVGGHLSARNVVGSAAWLLLVGCMVGCWVDMVVGLIGWLLVTYGTQIVVV